MPDDFYTDLGLAALISPLRLRGMSAMLARIKRRLRRSARQVTVGSGGTALDRDSHARRLNCPRIHS